MISICIPVYNFKISSLLEALTLQIRIVDAPVEIILIDDCSSQEYKKANLESCKKHTFIALKKNIGRSKIRNLFLDYAQYDHLLFLDCDSLIISETFLSDYIQAIKENKPLICGGRIYTSIKPQKNTLLRWKFGVKRESLSLAERKLEPNKSFMTNNFLISKALFKEIKFDERLSEYGHEDTLFGFELKKRGIAIGHIDNPVLNGDLESNTEYLEKTEQGIFNLISILDYINHDPAFIQDVSLLRFYNTLKQWRLNIFMAMLFPILKPLIKFLLIKGLVNLQLFDFYKMGILIQGINRHSN